MTKLSTSNSRRWVLCVGTPRVGKSASAHAIYVAIRHVSRAAPHSLQVVICNGGDGVERFHSRDPAFIADAEWQHYHYPAFTPISVDDVHAMDALKHYIYRALILRYVHVADTATLELRLRDLYLAEPNASASSSGFFGYNCAEGAAEIFGNAPAAYFACSVWLAAGDAPHWIQFDCSTFLRAYENSWREEQVGVVSPAASRRQAYPMLGEHV